MASANGTPSGERWYGTQEAAGYLGIHRSTLHLAVHRGTLVPDRTTPGGHLRFRQETLDRFREHLERNPITADVSAIAPLDVLRHITSTFAASARASEICQAAADSILRARMDFNAVAVLLVNRDTDPPRLDPMISMGYSEPFIHRLQHLFAQGVDLTTTHVLRTATPELVGDTARERLPFGSGQLARLGGIRAFAIYPLARGSQTFGTLVVASFAPRRFTAADRLFLSAVAGELALAISLEHYLDLTSRLMQIALGRAAGPEYVGGRASSRLSELRELLVRQTDAEDACALGFDDGGALTTRYPRLCRLAERAQARHQSITQTLRLQHRLYTGMAEWVALYDHRDASVAILWQGKRPASPADSVLLMVFAGACALASGRVRFEPDGPDDELEREDGQDGE